MWRILSFANVHNRYSRCPTRPPAPRIPPSVSPVGVQKHAMPRGQPSRVAVIKTVSNFTTNEPP